MFVFRTFRRWPIALGGLALLVSGCNMAVGGAAMLTTGGIAYLSWQCYDHVAITVRDMSTGVFTCDANVQVTSVDEPDVGWSLLPCYHVALTPGRWRLTAKGAGGTKASTELQIPERSGGCPHFTHTVEMTLWPAGTTPTRSQLRARQVASPVAPQVEQAPLRGLPPSRAFEITPRRPKPAP